MGFPKAINSITVPISPMRCWKCLDVMNMSDLDGRQRQTFLMLEISMRNAWEEPAKTCENPCAVQVGWTKLDIHLVPALRLLSMADHEIFDEPRKKDHYLPG